MRSFYKQIYRYTHRRSFRHSETLWPWMTITRADSGEINTVSYKHQSIPVCPLSELADRYQGDVLLTASGPSVRSIDFERLPEMPAMGVNGSWDLNSKVAFRFYIVVDMSFFKNKPDIIEEIISCPDIYFFTTVHGIMKMVETLGVAAIRCILVPIEDISSQVFRAARPLETLHDSSSLPGVSVSKDVKHIAFVTDIRLGIADAGTVVYWALQILNFCGFKRIFILGLDLNNFHQPRFYENQQNRLPTTLDDCLESKILPSLTLASEVLKTIHTEVINFSPNSAVPDTVFNKESFNEFFSEK